MKNFKKLIKEAHLGNPLNEEDRATRVDKMLSGEYEDEDYKDSERYADVRADLEREDQSKSSSLIGRMGDRSLREDDLNESMIEAQFEDLYQVVRNIHHVGGYDSIEDAAFEALQRIGEEFGVNFEEGRF